MRLTPVVRAVFGLEIRSLLRDPRTVLLSVVLPIVLIPGLLLAGGWMDDRRVEREDTRVYRFAVTGPDSAFAGELIAPVTGGDGRFRAVETAHPRAALEAGTLDLYVEAFSPEEWLRVEAEEDPEATGPPPEFEGARVLRVRFYSTRTASREGATAMRAHLETTRQARRDSIIVEAGLPVDPQRVAVVEAANVASADEVEGARLGRYLTLILLVLMVLGGSAVSTDTLAGEKERGTLQTLLTAAASRDEIVGGKLLAIVAVAFTITLIQALNLWIFLGLGLIDAAEGFGAAVTPQLAAGLIVLFLPLIALTSGILLLSSAHARSYKEAQLHLTPILIGLVVPALAPLLPDLSLRSAIVVVPLANLSLAARDLLIGQIDLPAMAAAWVVTAAAAVWVTTRSVRALHDEGLITGDTSREEFLGGPALFRKRVLHWFVAFWALKTLLDLNLPFEDVRAVSAVSVGIVFVLFPLVVIRHFRLDPVEALALTMPRPGVWLGVLLGAPAGVVVASTIFRLADHVVPVPTELLEGFGQSLLPEAIPVWQLVVFLAVVPGIAEELTFRGVLLHGLRRRFGPVGLALVVGLIFGFFHFQIFRMPSTAALGVALAAVTLLSGSILPAILWHTLNNAIAIGLTSTWVEAEFEGVGWALGGFAALGLAFWIIWRHRTPYPDVGKRGPFSQPRDRSPEDRAPEDAPRRGSRRTEAPR